MRPALLCIVPPFPFHAPPAGAAALLAFLRANDCPDFGFVDFRLWLPACVEWTFRSSGAFGETFVMDVPDLPLVLRLIRAFREGGSLVGVRDEVFDGYCLQRQIGPRALHRHLSELDRFFQRATAVLRHVRFIGFSVWTTNYLPTLIAAAHFKRSNPRLFVVAGGPHVSESVHSAQMGLRSGLFDAVVVGEGEQSLLELYRAFCLTTNGNAVKPIPGVMQLDRSTGIFHYEERSPLSISDLPVPCFRDMNLVAYQRRRRTRLLPFQLSRGCTDKCSFCAEWVLWKHYRSDTAEHAIQQVRQLQSEYGMGEIMFTDSLLNGHKGRLRAFAEALIQQSIKVTWGGFMRPDIDEELAALLYRAGCKFVFLGIESLSDETLALMNKRRTVAESLNAVRTFLEQGFRVVAGYIPGFPGDRRERFMETARTLCGLQEEFPGCLRLNVEQFVVSPNQPIYRKLDKYGLRPAGWEDRILDIDTEYRDITEDIYRSVSGENQGLERIGQYAVVAAMAADSRAAPTHGFDPFAEAHFCPHAAIPFDDIATLPLSPRWWLGQSRMARGQLLSLILNDRERNEFVQMRRELRARLESTLNRQDLMESEDVRHLVRTISARHVALPSIDQPPVSECGFPTVLGDNVVVSLSPFLLARVVDPDDANGLILVDHVSLRTGRIHASNAAFLAHMSTSPRRIGDLVQYAVDSESPLDPRDVRSLLASLVEDGFVVEIPPHDPDGWKSTDRASHGIST